MNQLFKKWRGFLCTFCLLRYSFKFYLTSLCKTMHNNLFFILPERDSKQYFRFYMTPRSVLEWLSSMLWGKSIEYQWVDSMIVQYMLHFTSHSCNIKINIHLYKYTTSKFIYWSVLYIKIWKSKDKNPNKNITQKNQMVIVIITIKCILKYIKTFNNAINYCFAIST